MISERWKEEIVLLKTEMERFLSFYSSVVMQKLEGDIKEINKNLQSFTGIVIKMKP